MKTKFFVLISLLVVFGALISACAPIAAAAQAPSTTPVTRQITATGEGKVYLTPDTAYINIGVHTESDSVANALNDNTRQAQAVSDSLKELGVDPLDVQTSAFNVYPQQQYDKNGVPTTTKYVVDNTVVITVRDLTKLGQILDTTVRSGANNVNGIQFDVKDKPSAIAEARKLAIEDARNTAQDLAATAGVELGNLDTLSVYSNGGTVPIYEGKGGGASMSVAASVPVSSGQLVIIMDATLVYEIK
jgi:uncharacterized protein YggE